MSNIDSAWATPNELLAPRNFWREQQQTDAYTQNVALQKQHQERELEGDDYKTIANTAGYLLSLPNEQSRADAWSKIYPDLPDHIRARAPSAYQGEGWARGAMARAIPALDQWKRQQDQAGIDSLLGGGGGGGGAAASGAPGPATNYGASGKGASATVSPEMMGYFQEASRETGIPVDRLIAQGRQESSLNANAVGGAGELGVMQIHPKTAAAPGFGMAPVDPATLRSARDNIMFGARYLKARMGAGADPNDAATWERGLAGYNGGGDPNYVANVTRYLPAPGGAPARGVAARTGGTDTAGPGAGPTTVPTPPPAMAPDAAPVPGDSVMAPDVRSRVLSLAGSPPNAFGPQNAPPSALPAPPVESAPSAPPAPPAPPAPTPAAPAMATREQVQRAMGVDARGLTPQDYTEIRAGSTTREQAATAMEQRRQYNERRVDAAMTAQHQAMQDQRQAARDQLAREEADLKRVEANRPYPGNSPEAADMNTLIAGSQPGGDSSSTAFHNAWQRVAYKETEGGGATIKRNMDMFASPTDKAGKPVAIPPPTVTSGASQQFTQANTLRDEFVARTKTFPDVQIAYENIQKAAEAKDGAGDMSLLYSYVHLLDPGSAVREGEFATAAASGSLGQRVQGAVAKLATGGRLPDDLRRDFVRESAKIYQSHLGAYNQMADVYTGLAKRSNIDPDRVVTRISRPQGDQEQVSRVVEYDATGKRVKK
jgi:soluble lytic murein transglycosylase-like protein